MPNPTTTQLSLGPLLFNWPPERRVDFYRRIADEAPVDTVYVGEVVCAKRLPLAESTLAEVIDRLQRGGKTVVLSTLSLIMDERELNHLKALIDSSDLMIEANDVSAMHLLDGRPHIAGPFINIYNEGTLAFAGRQGAVRAVLTSEVNGHAIAAMARSNTGVTLEVQAFGRLPLALSSRCYHARHHGLHRDGCQFVCGNDPDGLTIETLDGQPFLALNGTQTLSHTVCSLLEQAGALQNMGVSHLRLWPHDVDMPAVATLFRTVLDGRTEPADAAEQLSSFVGFAAFANGFFFAREGHRFVHGPWAE